MSGVEATLLGLDLLSRPSLVASRVGGELRAAWGSDPHPLVDLGQRVEEVLGEARPSVVGVVVGPGSLLALRSAASFARAYAAAGGALGVGLSSAEVFAASFPEVRELTVLEPVGRGRMVRTQVRDGVAVEEELVTSDTRFENCCVVGHLSEERSPAGLGLLARTPSPAGLIEATLRALREGRSVAPRALQVRYVVDAGVRAPTPPKAAGREQ